MATFGLTYFLIGLGEIIFGGEPKVMITSELYLPKGALEWKVFGGFVSFQKIDIAAAIIASIMVATLRVFFQKTADRPRPARGRRQSQGRVVGRHLARADLGDRVVRRRHRRARPPASCGARAPTCPSRCRPSR